MANYIIQVKINTICTFSNAFAIFALAHNWASYIPPVLGVKLTLKVPVMTINAQWEGMGDVGSARYETALLPLCPTIKVLSYSN